MQVPYLGHSHLLLSHFSPASSLHSVCGCYLLVLLCTNCLHSRVLYVSRYKCEYINYQESWIFAALKESGMLLTTRDRNNIAKVTPVGTWVKRWLSDESQGIQCPVALARRLSCLLLVEMRKFSTSKPVRFICLYSGVTFWKDPIP